jgi:hypothetical protein
MRDKIVIMEKRAYKTAKGHQLKKKEEKNREKWIKRESCRFWRKTNNAPVVISLE